ncbi:MAG: hypothetical protein QOF53_770 [Nocardioidaceae bacterium]|jgi:hypothetical protein|nr:hypothetical protein [Nocardioidaceae bacterium]
MNAHSIARKLLTGTAVAVVAATCLISAGTATTSAAGHQHANTVQATKEYKVAPSTKEY